VKTRFQTLLSNSTLRRYTLAPVIGSDWGITQVGLDEVFRLLTTSG
jgi:hypothetical protein